MEMCIESRALKSSFLSQMNPQMLCNDDVWCINNVPSDDFPVEDLLNLDFSDKEDEGDEAQKQDSSLQTDSVDRSPVFTGADDFNALSIGEFSLPVEDLENLEWLSQFVNDSSSEVSLLCPVGGFTEKPGVVLAANRFEPVKKLALNSSFPSKIPGKSRSKRSRENGRPWSLASPALSSDETSSASSSSHGSNVLSPFVFANPVQEIEWFSAVEKPPPAKKQRIKPVADGGLVSGRRCTHCQVQKTPQWRAGPLGPKTLCNACGVRFKSGRLFPEYRPACSPTFSQEIHSNSHRKVLEMRRRQEALGAAEPGLIATVQS